VKTALRLAGGLTLMGIGAIIGAFAMAWAAATDDDTPGVLR
jgi:hypothetical protein